MTRAGADQAARSSSDTWVVAQPVVAQASRLRRAGGTPASLDCASNVPGFGQCPRVILALLLVVAGASLGEELHAGRKRVPPRSGFPADFTASPFGSEVRGSPVAVDIDGDGRKEILFGAFDGMIHLFRDDGREVRDGLWPRHTGGPIVGTVKAGDLDGDGRPEIVAGSFDGKVYAFSDRGERLWLADSHQPGLSSTPILTGRPGPKTRGVVFATPDGTLHSLDAGGGRTWLFPGHGPTSFTPAEVDLAGSGERQILSRNDAGVFQLLDGQGREVRHWPGDPYVDKRGPSSFAVADLDGDGAQEIVAEQRESLRPESLRQLPGAPSRLPRQGEEGIFVWTPQGEVAAAFPLEGAAPASVRAADVDGDGERELVFADEKGKVHVTGPAGWPRAGWPLEVAGLYRQVNDHRLDPRGRPQLEKAPAVADVDGDGAADLVFTVNDPRQPEELGGMVFAVSRKGALIEGFPKPIGRNHGELLVADLDDDGDMELVVPGGAGGTARQLHVFDLPVSQKLEMMLLGSEFKPFRE